MSVYLEQHIIKKINALLSILGYYNKLFTKSAAAMFWRHASSALIQHDSAGYVRTTADNIATDIM